MRGILQPETLSIVVVAEKHNPTILNPDFLYRNQIVPEDWKQVQDPICTPPLARVVFESGVGIETQFDKVIFTERDATSIPEGTVLAEVALRYIGTLPHVSYRAVGINPHGFVECDSEEAVRLFLLGTLIGEGPWRKVGDKPPHAAVRLIYTFGDCQCTLSVEEARARPGEGGAQKPVVTFRANFHRALAADSHNRQLDRLLQVIRGWRNDYELFERIVGETFLREAEACQES
jgi:hypothetical protein